MFKDRQMYKLTRQQEVIGIVTKSESKENLNPMKKKY